MKTKHIRFFAAALLLAFFSCESPQKAPEKVEVQVDLINDAFPEAQKEVRATLDAIKQSVMDGDVDKLISFHAYSPKFTEFNAGMPRVGAAENEKHERGVFGSVSEIVKFDMNDMKVAVYGDVANVTLHTDFHLMFGEDHVKVNDQMTLLFVKTADGWKIVHEHHSPLKMPEEG